MSPALAPRELERECAREACVGLIDDAFAPHELTTVFRR